MQYNMNNRIDKVEKSVNLQTLFEDIKAEKK